MNIVYPISGDQHDAVYNRSYVFTIAVIAAMGGLMFGYDWAVIGDDGLSYEKYFNLTSPFHVGWAMSSAIVDAFVGAIEAGVLGLSMVYLATGAACFYGPAILNPSLNPKSDRNYHAENR